MIAFFRRMASAGRRAVHRIEDRFRIVDTTRPYEISPELNKSLAGRVAVVTGGSGSIGRAVCVMLSAHGAKVYVCGTNADRTVAVVAEIRQLGGLSEPLLIDLTSETAIVNSVASVAATNGRIDIFVACAGGSSRARYFGIDSMPTAQMRQILEVNLVGAMICTREVSKHMIANGFGRIIFIGSVIADKGKAKLSEYAAAKGGLAAFCRTIAIELGRHNITANCVSPGIVQRGEITGQELKHLRTTNQLNEVGTAEDVGAAVLYLASPDARFVTGQDLKVDGGRSLGLKGD